MSKAFDKVNHYALLMKLMKRLIPVPLLKIFEFWFDNSNTCIKWNNLMSTFIKLNFGVRQGSVLSPTFFAIYIDDIVTRNNRLSVVIYADDILIISKSVSELQNIYNICEIELLNLDMAINEKRLVVCVSDPDIKSPVKI